MIKQLQENAKMLWQMKALTPLVRLAEPEDVAAAILFLSSPVASMITATYSPSTADFLRRDIGLLDIHERVGRGLRIR
jgi:NAD(P)-dependent dehydrogenase (short-subunit alcohol dehydrogenase family)